MCTSLPRTVSYGSVAYALSTTVASWVTLMPMYSFMPSVMRY